MLGRPPAAHTFVNDIPHLNGNFCWFDEKQIVQWAIWLFALRRVWAGLSTCDIIEGIVMNSVAHPIPTNKYPLLSHIIDKFHLII